MRTTMRWVLSTAVLVGACGSGQAQTSPYRAGEQVELQASGDHWQSCVVVDPGSASSVMRLDCEPYQAPGYSRGGGIYVETITSSGVRKVGQTAATTANVAEAGTGARAAGGGEGTNATAYRVGQAVELEASGHWVPCVVSSIQGSAAAPMIRTDCPAYPALSRAAGTYIVHDVAAGLRPATGQTGPAPRSERPAPAAAAGGTLPLGEYACYGSGGQILAGLGFKLTSGGRYSDLDGATSGSYAINGSTITFRGGHLDGQTGREINGKGFRIGLQATCELWG